MSTTAPTHSRRSAILTVTDVVAETPLATSLTFEVPTEAIDRFGYAPGQFLTLRIPSERTGSVARSYSLSSSPFDDPRPTVTIKRTDGGYASNWLCDNICVGDQIESLPPAGVFTPRDLDVPLLLIAGGSGVTPIMSILTAALSQGHAPITMVYANRSADDVIFADRLDALTAANPDRLTVVHWPADQRGLPTAAALAPVLRPHRDREVFLCGPAPFMEVTRTALSDIGVERAAIHTEVYLSLTGDPFTDPAPTASDTTGTGTDTPGIDTADAPGTDTADAAKVAVELDGTVHQLDWPRDQTLVEVMLAAGIDVPYSCQAGECGSCTATISAGTVEMTACEALDPDDVADGYILGCQARPTADRIEIAF
ncbi:ferredoxin--NADP reductase [Williamsia sp. CHRR-6]|uniref:ferredoxin--NADP reductase n=1 Tax=Williamsia sp. CHRR-6 TaxID=2835871 RepID=UPI001BDA73B2|nr:ferredoxin--NADP reductase [Williamsia sp. CHRR-6]MBT0565783.1 ferredoxin--NADP reductase [Williamsia sp. CHRR-6]